MQEKAWTTPPFVIGVDFGTDSVRTLIVDAAGGTEIAAAVAPYRRWAAGRYCDPVRNRFRQHPLDYVEGLEESITTHSAGPLPERPVASGGSPLTPRVRLPHLWTVPELRLP